MSRLWRSTNDTKQSIIGLQAVSHSMPRLAVFEEPGKSTLSVRKCRAPRMHNRVAALCTEQTDLNSLAVCLLWLLAGATVTAGQDSHVRLRRILGHLSSLTQLLAARMCQRSVHR